MTAQPVICLFWLLLVLSLSSSCIYASEEEDYIEEENDYQEYYDGDYDYEDDLASGDTAPSGSDEFGYPKRGFLGVRGFGFWVTFTVGQKI